MSITPTSSIPAAETAAIIVSLVLIVGKIIILFVVCRKRAEIGKTSDNTQDSRFLTLTMDKFLNDMEREKPIRLFYPILLLSIPCLIMSFALASSPDGDFTFTLASPPDGDWTSTPASSPPDGDSGGFGSCSCHYYCKLVYVCEYLYLYLLPVAIFFMACYKRPIIGKSSDSTQDSRFLTLTMDKFLNDMEKEKPISLPESQEWFPKWVWKRFESKEMGDLVIACEIEEKDKDMAERMVKVALWCVQYKPQSRPLMSVVVKMLEGGVEIPTPLNPFEHLTSENPCPALPPHGAQTSSFLDSDSSQMTTVSNLACETTPIMKKYEIEIASC
ncbi:hypothetical protein FEM48_Zijuj01G0010800 [Ziziphus jujuba var. spinosa]|uniref:Uncharacterized protein n=1 Tax=Ziziphus jujuba var. spinosa TaxID=714518 RepID=A0A978VY90_ZIZJJ|nr:hypothetical protein FEM48_Zijuj01G0010800 [Ziziphus jujuba var. spinosa]